MNVSRFFYFKCKLKRSSFFSFFSFFSMFFSVYVMNLKYGEVKCSNGRAGRKSEKACLKGRWIVIRSRRLIWLGVLNSNLLFIPVFRRRVASRLMGATIHAIYKINIHLYQGIRISNSIVYTHEFHTFQYEGSQNWILLFCFTREKWLNETCIYCNRARIVDKKWRESTWKIVTFDSINKTQECRAHQTISYQPTMKKVKNQIE